MSAALHDLTLLIPEGGDPERDSVADAWQRRGGSVLRLGRFWEPPEVDRSRVRVYGGDAFCLVLSEKLNLDLISPPDDLSVRLDRRWTRRSVRIAPLGESPTWLFPVFVKPLVPKSFTARVYSSLDELAAECRGLQADTQVILSDFVSFVAEARAFVLAGEVTTCAVYEGRANPSEARSFAARLAREQGLPVTCVLDVGLLDAGKWALIEANAAWGVGLNGCDAEGAVPCIAAASGPRQPAD